jgi:L-lactate dehydrogenase complex protein LldG
MSDTGDRKQILERIREALKYPAPKPGSHGDGHAASPQHASPASGNGQSGIPLPVINNQPHEVSDWLPRVGETWEEQVSLFAANATDLKAHFHLCDSREDLLSQLSEMSRQHNWGRIATHQGELTDFATQTLGLPLVRTDGDYKVFDVEACDVGITQCDALIAQTGSVLITNSSAGGRVLSILPPHHIVLATRDQLLPDLPSAFRLLKERYGNNYPSLMSFVTGPSRTGDIERILVLGAHGPKNLTILCV